MSNNHILGYEDGGLGSGIRYHIGHTEGVGKDDVLSCSIFTNPINYILENFNEWPSGSARFFMRGPQIQGNG